MSKPTLIQVILAVAFQKTDVGRNVIRRVRRMIAESVEFDQINSLVPIAATLMTLRFFIAVTFGLLFGPLIRVAYHFKSPLRSFPDSLEDVQQPEVP